MRRKRKAPDNDKTRSTDPRFFYQKDHDWYKDIENMGFVEEQTVPEVFDNEFNIHAAFEHLGWEEILKLPNKYYPELVKEFYANLKEKDKVNCISLSSYVRGKSIEITDTKLNEWYKFPGKGGRLHFSKMGDKSQCTLDRDWDKTAAIKHLDIPYSINRKKQWTVYAKFCSIKLRLIAWLLRTNMMPTHSTSTNELRLTDIFTLQMMTTNPLPEHIPGIDLAKTIIEEIWNAAKSKSHFIFPCLISDVLKKHKVGLSHHESVIVPVKLNEDKMKNFGYTKIAGVWTNARQHGSVDYPVPLHPPSHEPRDDEPESSSAAPSESYDIATRLTNLEATQATLLAGQVEIRASLNLT
ncbi:hypothetical protein CCACVL1_04032 [Corchorus capsularis]|uniref:Putative plant transposon protein domain-containing protein n=1 Tax=Corchorus capsularis TaxID=210143 RepID=A0A1R3JVJ0_COCAP|nr:hypothetical protein CCACVL1_04032 [Corchorus capsularis]